MGIFSIFQRNDVLYYPGCSSIKFKEYLELYKKIFEKLKIPFVVLNSSCCGLALLESGYEIESRKTMRKNLHLFKENGITEIFTTCPACFRMFKEYEKLPDFDLKILNIWDLILDKLEKKPRLIKNKSDEEIGYHDNCYLGRYSQIYESPRKILELLGYSIKEFEDSRENSFCCGSCGGLYRINPELANKIAKERILQAKRKGIKKIIVTSLDNYEILKNNTKDIEILELSDVLGKALKIKKENKEEILIN